MADDNKPLKYMRYAIGEIVLVVIGILIALQINNRNEQHKSDAKIAVLFEKVLIELAANINETQRVIQGSKDLDSLNNLVFQNKLTYDDYANPTKLDKDGYAVIGNLYLASDSWTGVFLNTSAYNNLLLNMDAIPSKYEDVVSELNFLNQFTKREVELSNEEVINLGNSIQRERRLKYEWYHLTWPNEGIIDYMLNNYLFKNELDRYYALNIRQLNRTLRYRISAVRIYQEIAALLNKPLIHESFKVDPEIVRLITGTYNFIESHNPEDKEEYLEVIKFENNLMMTYQPRDTSIAWESTILDFNKTKSKTSISTLRNSGSVYLTYMVQGDTLTVNNHNNWYWKFLKVK